MVKKQTCGDLLCCQLKVLLRDKKRDCCRRTVLYNVTYFYFCFTENITQICLIMPREI